MGVIPANPRPSVTQDLPIFMKRIQIDHETSYNYTETVTLGPHRLMIRPRAGHDIRVDHAELTISVPHTLTWHRDIYGNSVAVVTFSEPTGHLSIRSRITLQHFEAEPQVFRLDDKALVFPFYSDLSDRIEMIPYQMLCFPSDNAAVGAWAAQFWRPGQVIETSVLLDNICQSIARTFLYNRREEPGVQRPSETLQRMSGSCRDFATLFIETCRFFGFAARFVSGYLHNPASSYAENSTHAWAEVYLPGLGWKGFDTTSGLVTGHDHIATAVTRHPADAPPISGIFFATPSVQSNMRVTVSVNELFDQEPALSA